MLACNFETKKTPVVKLRSLAIFRGNDQLAEKVLFLLYKTLRDPKEEERSRGNQECIVAIVAKRSQKQKQMAFNFDEKYRLSYFLYDNILSAQKN